MTTLHDGVLERRWAAQRVRIEPHATTWVVASAAVLALLLIWMEPLPALRAAAGTAAFVALGLAVSRRISEGLPVFARSALALVVSAAIFSLSAIGIAIAGAPLAATPIIVLGATVALILAIAPGAQAAIAGRAPSVLRANAALTYRGFLVAVALAGAAIFLIPTTVGRVVFGVYAIAFFWMVRPRVTSANGEAREEPPVQPSRPWVDVVPLALLGLLLATRLLPFLRSSIPLGYDAGLYRGVQADVIAALPSWPSFVERSWANVQPPGLFVLTDLLHLAGWSTEALLWGLLVLVQIVFAAGMWLLARDLGGRAVANWTVLLVVLSSVQFLMFFEVYFKQAVGLAVLPYVFWCWRRESWLVVPLGAFLAATHNMSFLLLGLVLLSDLVLSATDGARPRLALRRYSYNVVAGGAILFAGLLAYVLTPDAIGTFVSFDPRQLLATFGPGSAVGEGSFSVDASQYALLVCTLIPFAALTVARHWRDPALRLVLLWAMWSGAFAVLGLIFARRFVGFLDPAFLVLAAIAIGEVTAARTSIASRSFVAIAMASAAVFLVAAMGRSAPLVHAAELRDLESTTQSLPDDAYLMAISGTDASFVRGWGHRDTIAPGMFEHDRWTHAEWLTFWAPPTGQDRYDLLAEYRDRPIYVFMSRGLTLPTIALDPRFEQVSPTVWRYVAQE